MKSSFLRCLTFLTALAALSSCGGFLGESGDGPPLPGDRISILTFDRGVRPDETIADTDVVLPDPYENAIWSQPGGSATHGMYHLALAEEPSLAWKANVGRGSDDDGRILTQPIVVNGVVYTMDSQGLVTAFDATAGKRIWEVDLSEDQEDEGYFGGGIAYEQGRLFVTTGFAKIFALDAASGEVQWDRRLPGPAHNGPAVQEERVYALSLDNQIQVFGAEDGRLLWNNVGVEEAASVMGAASPAVSEEIVVVPYTTGELLGIRIDNGRVLWAESLAAFTRLDPLADIPQIRGHPVIDRGMVLAISHSGRMLALELQRGLRLWEVEIGGIDTPWVAGDFVYVLSSDSQVVALRRDDGRVRWVTLLPRYEDEEDREGLIRWTGPVLAGNRLIVAGSNGLAVSMSPYTGAMLGEIELPDAVAVAPTVADGTLYFLTDNADLLAFR
jgi:outer membrane protein assembly factor BamB